MRALYDSKSYTIDDKGIKKQLSKTAKYQAWLDVEIALAKAQGEFGVIPNSAAKNIGKVKLEDIDFEEMDRIYKKIGHGFVPFLKVLTKACDEESGKYVHYGVTTQNIQQTSQLFIIKEINKSIYLLLGDTLKSLSKLALEHKETVIAGRTHGQHALPITYGYKASVWISELLTSIERMKEAEKRIFTVMMGGAIGAFNSSGEVGRLVQDRVAEILDMESMDIPSRNMSLHKIEYIMNLSLIASTAHKVAEEIYYTSGSEYSEVSEAFQKGTIGSSTMPQKINPKLSKGIIANSQKLYSLIATGLYSCPRLFEGDSSSYMLLDGLLEEAIELIREILPRFEELVRTLTIKPKNMAKNIKLTNGLINSEHIMMKMASRLGKDKAHKLIYELSIKSTNENIEYSKLLMENEVISLAFTQKEILEILDPKNYIGLCSKMAEEFSEKAINHLK
ncbi:MAG: adenylosuccinate lyase family protein [Psychrilyobacter sp.]|uniref:class-II fumarase/aspartase family protein n=1 Tax=Psychrilyobacter sp. TaxID=2586924 RepID=UPI003C7723F6